MEGRHVALRRLRGKVGDDVAQAQHLYASRCRESAGSRRRACSCVKALLDWHDRECRRLRTPSLDFSG